MKKIFLSIMLLAAIGTAGILLLILPKDRWNAATLSAALFLIFSITFSFYIPFASPKNRVSGNASVLALIGPVLLLGIMLILMAIFAFWIAFNFDEKIAFAFLIFCVVLLVITLLHLKASTVVIDGVGDKNNSLAKTNAWRSRLLSLSERFSLSDQIKANSIIERLEFHSRGDSELIFELDSKIDSILDQLTENISNQKIVSNDLKFLSETLEIRDRILKNSYSKI